MHVCIRGVCLCAHARHKVRGHGARGKEPSTKHDGALPQNDKWVELVEKSFLYIYEMKGCRDVMA